MRKLIPVVLVAALTVGCAESELVRSVPPDAKVFIDDKLVGSTPINFATQDVRPLPYRIEKPGYPAAEGTIQTRIAPGRVVGAVFTLGILAIFRSMHYFTPNPLDVIFGPEVPAAAVIHLYDVKGATVLEGECAPRDGKCWIALSSGARCSGEYVREDQGTTTITQTTSATAGSAVGAAPGGIATASFGARNSAVGEGKQMANMNKAVTVLRCADNVIDCSLTVDSSGAHGHGECTDTKGRTYRLTLVPKTDAATSS
jgi:PEGA domain-containing protein